MISPAEAEAAIRAHAAPLPATSLPLDRARRDDAARAHRCSTRSARRSIASRWTASHSPSPRTSAAAARFASPARRRPAPRRCSLREPRALHRSDDRRDAAHRLRLRDSSREDLGARRRRAARTTMRRPSPRLNIHRSRHSIAAAATSCCNPASRLGPAGSRGASRRTGATHASGQPRAAHRRDLHRR